MLDDRAIAGLRALVSEPGPGDVLGDRFELGELIGEGGMGFVHAAFDRQTQREVAVKIVREAGADERFGRECAALEAVVHPAIVPYVARGAENGVQWLVMDRLVGSTLASRLHRDGKLGIADTLALGRRVAEALATAHGLGIVHRDVKPSNLFLSEDAAARVRLLDFGIARDVAAPALTRTGALVGTPGYMAPEQARGERATAAADVFALGCVLFECLTGRPAFSGKTTEILLAQILLEVPPHTREHRAEVPVALDALVVEMLDKGAAVRPSADSVARELGAIEGHLLTESGGDKHEAAAPGLREGDVVDKYRIERRIGEGGMGIVMAARHVELGKRVALKVLRGSDPADVPRFLREAQAASRLESEHVARVLDVGRTPDGAPFIVMEYLSGSDLARRLVERGPLPVRTAVGYVLEACEAIAESHSLGIVHRDLKPSNLFVVSRRDGSELVKVLDFGISKLTRPLEGASAGASMTGASAVIGSASYMSPEQLASSKHVDERTDIWALGVVLHELITGARPFEGDSAAAVGARIAASEPRRLRELAKDAPEALEAVILACLVKDPDRRMPNVAALVTALLPFRSPEAPVSAESAGPPQEGPAAFVTRARVGVGIAALVVVAGVGVIATMRGDADKATRPAADAAPVVVTAEAPVATSSPPAGGRPAPEPTASAPSASSLAVQPATGVPGATAPREASPAATQRLAPPARDPVAPSTRPGAGAASSPPPAAATVRPKSDLDLRDPALEGR